MKAHPVDYVSRRGHLDRRSTPACASAASGFVREMSSSKLERSAATPLRSVNSVQRSEPRFGDGVPDNDRSGYPLNRPGFDLRDAVTRANS